MCIGTGSSASMTNQIYTVHCTIYEDERVHPLSERMQMRDEMLRVHQRFTEIKYG